MILGPAYSILIEPRGSRLCALVDDGGVALIGKIENSNTVVGGNGGKNIDTTFGA